MMMTTTWMKSRMTKRPPRLKRKQTSSSLTYKWLITWSKDCTLGKKGTSSCFSSQTKICSSTMIGWWVKPREQSSVVPTCLRAFTRRETNLASGMRSWRTNTSSKNSKKRVSSALSTQTSMKESHWTNARGCSRVETEVQISSTQKWWSSGSL